MQIISNIALITINETLVIQLVSFLIFVFLLNRVMVRPLLSTMDEREKFISNLRQEAEDTVEKMNNLTAQMQNQEEAARSEALAMMKEAEDAGKSQASEIFDSAHKEITELKESTQKLINEQIAEARKHVSKESEVLAVKIMEKVLERRLM
ncbi:ATP synthase, subunit beta (ATP synthase F0 sector subunit b) [Desulfonema limicola]|uniref:ATP synthase subunit b n=1 Tax=Desulfonema limicola TaxID=45656 RepID=A0A975B3L7_9BACT|nr:F0F1 ATP synthase subunit B [Desulfonema limicola]QTA78169.1 ATP synthase, subunit beta (ATP synthase F0 sector subunit b) [Desulfonema limicola]